MLIIEGGMVQWAKYVYIVVELDMLQDSTVVIDWDVFWNSHRQLPVFVCQLRKINFRFPFPFAANRRKFAISILRLQQTNGNCRFLLVPFFTFVSVCIFIFILTFKYTFILQFQTHPRRFFLIRLPFAHCANGSLSFVRLLTKKQMEVICWQTD